jgi:hypothetical protein
MKMVKGIAKGEADEKEGRGYTSGRHVREGNMEGEEPAGRKRARAGNNQLTCCKCGAIDHQRVLSKNCAWKGLSKKVIFKNYEKRMKYENGVKSAGVATGCTEPTKDYVQSTSKFLAPMQTR